MEKYEKKSNLIIIKFYFFTIKPYFLIKIYHHKFKKRFLR